MRSSRTRAQIYEELLNSPNYWKKIRPVLLKLFIVHFGNLLLLPMFFVYPLAVLEIIS